MKPPSLPSLNAQGCSLLVKQDTGAAITTLPPDPISQGIGRQGRDRRQVAKLWMISVLLVLDRNTGRKERT